MNSIKVMPAGGEQVTPVYNTFLKTEKCYQALDGDLFPIPTIDQAMGQRMNAGTLPASKEP